MFRLVKTVAVALEDFVLGVEERTPKMSNGTPGSFIVRFRRIHILYSNSARVYHLSYTLCAIQNQA